MLKDPASREVVLAHGCLQVMDRGRNQGVGLPQFAKCQMERFLVPVNIAVIKIGVLVEPHAQSKRSPTTLLVHHDLARLEFRLVRWARAATTPPNGRRTFIL